MSDEHVKEGFEHLQAAAIEVINAMRSFLDAAEELVRDPGEAMNAVTLLAAAGRFAAGAATYRPADGDGVTRVQVS